MFAWRTPFLNRYYIPLGRSVTNLLYHYKGSIFSRILFDQLNFNPYFESVIAFLFLILAMMVFGFLFYWLAQMPAAASVAFFLVFMIHPIFVEQFYFTLQVMDISFAILLTAVSLFTSILASIYHKVGLAVLSILLMIWSFSTYQLFVILYIAGAVFCYILLYRRLTLENKKSAQIDSKSYGKFILRLIALFLFAMLINTVITKLFFSNSTYTSNMVLWGKQPAKDCLNNILKYIKQVVLGKSIFYSYAYIISAVLMLVTMVYGILHNRTAKLKWLYILAGIGLQICPFLLTIYEGNIPPVRAQFVLPFVIACNMGFVIMCCHPFKNMHKIAIAICVLIVFFQAQTVLRLEYTDNIRFQEDMRLGSQVSERISAITDGVQKPVAFVGTKPAKLNAACVQGELIGASIFSIDSVASPHYFCSSNRICTLLQTMGFNLDSVSANQMIEARKIASNMPVWPAHNSVIETKNMVVVKLSDDRWYADDIMKPKAQKVQLRNLKFQNNKLRWAVDNASVKNGMLTVTGWLIQPENSSQNANISVYLLSNDNGDCYKLATKKIQRPDVSKTFQNEKTDYDDSGYAAKAPINDLDKNLDKYQIILSYKKESETMFANTGVSIKNQGD